MFFSKKVNRKTPKYVLNYEDGFFVEGNTAKYLHKHTTKSFNIGDIVSIRKNNVDKLYSVVSVEAKGIRYELTLKFIRPSIL